jgi:hypothetical protein
VNFPRWLSLSCKWCQRVLKHWSDYHRTWEPNSDNWYRRLFPMTESIYPWGPAREGGWDQWSGQWGLTIAKILGTVLSFGYRLGLCPLYFLYLYLLFLPFSLSSLCHIYIQSQISGTVLFFGYRLVRSQSQNSGQECGNPCDYFGVWEKYVV